MSKRVGSLKKSYRSKFLGVISFGIVVDMLKRQICEMQHRRLGRPSPFISRRSVLFTNGNDLIRDSECRNTPSWWSFPIWRRRRAPGARLGNTWCQPNRSTLYRQASDTLLHQTEWRTVVGNPRRHVPGSDRVRCGIPGLPSCASILRD